MKRKKQSKILIGSCLVLVFALALSLISACAPPPPPPPPPPPAPAPAPAPPPPPAPPPKPEPIVLRAVHWTTDVRMEAFGYWWLIDWVKERSNGELIIEHKGGGEAISYKEQFTALRSGVIDVNLAPASFHFATYPFGQLTHLAKTNPDGTLPKEVKEYLYEKYAEIGVRFLESTKIWQPWHMFLIDVKATSLADIAGLKIATSGAAHTAFAENVGAVPVTMGTTEFYSALERGLVDGALFGTDMYRLGMHEVVKYIVLPPYKHENNVSLFMNLETWNKLPKHLQDVVTEVADDLAIEGLKRDIADAEKHWKVLMEAGLETTELNPTDAAKWVTVYMAGNWQKVKEWDPVEYEKMRKLAEIGEGPAGLPF